MGSIEDIYKAIAADGFSERTLQLIDGQINNSSSASSHFFVNRQLMIRARMRARFVNSIYTYTTCT